MGKHHCSHNSVFHICSYHKAHIKAGAPCVSLCTFKERQILLSLSQIPVQVSTFFFRISDILWDLFVMKSQLCEDKKTGRNSRVKAAHLYTLWVQFFCLRDLQDFAATFEMLAHFSPFHVWQINFGPSLFLTEAHQDLLSWIAITF